MATTYRPRVFLDISIGAEPVGRLTVELFTDKTPRTAENFRQLCTGEHNGLSYAKVPLHRIIDDFMVQGGDIESGDGTGAQSIYGAEFEDENLNWRKLDAAGLICSANRGKDTNGSQFFITLDACPHLDGKHTIFGRLVSGEHVLQQIAKVEVDEADHPLEPVLISRCGELARKDKGKAKRDSQQEIAGPTTPGTDERGRRRQSDLSDDEMSAVPQPAQRRTRRQSDNTVDEGKRGRPRIRSRSRSDNSQALEEVDEPNSDHSSVKMHKRKRSQSPSRRLDRRSDGAEAERRRKSLPNQYNNHRTRDRERNHGPDDEDRYRPSPRRDNQRYPGRQNDNTRHRSRYADEGRLANEGDDGRLDSGDSYDDQAHAVKYKGRGAMKFREW